METVRRHPAGHLKYCVQEKVKVKIKVKADDQLNMAGPDSNLYLTANSQSSTGYNKPVHTACYPAFSTSILCLLSQG
jgi:hypothetical protein